MSALMLFAQAADAAPAVNANNLENWMLWFIVWGEPSVTLGRWWGGLVSWSKVVGLYCLLAWVVGWLIAASRTDTPGQKASPLKLGAVIAIVVTGLIAALLGVLEDTGRLKLMAIGGAKPGTWMGILSAGILLGLVEAMLWSVMTRKKETADLICLFAMHVVFVVGYVIAYKWNVFTVNAVAIRRAQNIPTPDPPDWRSLGMRIGGTYMGLVALLRVCWMLWGEVLAIRFRRIYSIAWQAVAEANRSNRAPYVVVSLFVVVLAFTHWFIRAGDRDAELSRGYVQTLTFLCSILLLLMIVFVAPLSMPRDILNQTIYTMVSKPVRRIELIWGRLVGYMALVTVLLGAFGAVGLLYLHFTVTRRIDELRAEARKFEGSKPDYAKQRAAEADQLESRMSARVPLKGSLIFLDSKKKEHERGIDVGQEQETRTFVEGATDSRAIWRYDDQVPDFSSPNGLRDLRVPVESLLKPGSLEALEDQYLNLIDQRVETERQKSQGGQKASDISKFASESSSLDAEIARLDKEVKDMRAKERDIRARLRTAPRDARPKIRDELNQIISPPIPLEMTFTIYRTTKGVLGEPVLANITASNPRAGSQSFSAVVPIHEYYTNKTSLPARVLVGSRGRIKLEVRCVTANQYLGMAEGDLYILAGSGGFNVNFLKGLFGIWLQVLVLTAIGLFAGTFLSWPVAILTTLFFFLFGQVAFSYLAQFAVQALDTQAFGPFESLIRILGHQNMQAALAATPAVIAAKTADSVVLPVMSRLVFLIPNFGALDVSNTVAEGFAVTWAQIRDLTLMGVGYALPFSVAGYFILKNREVAA